MSQKIDESKSSFKDLKLIVTSATLEAERFSKFFEDLKIVSSSD